MPPAASVRIAVVPAAAAMLPEVSPAQPQAVGAQLRSTRIAAARCLSSAVGRFGVDTVLCIVADDVSSPRLVTTDALTLAPLGYPQVTAAVAGASLRNEAANLGLAVDHDRMDGPAAVVALQVLAQSQIACGFLLLPHLASVDELDHVASRLVQSFNEGPNSTIVAAGDLSATLTERSPGYLVAGASAFDDQMIAALKALDVARLGKLASSARAFMAYGWPSLYLVARVATTLGLTPTEINYSAPCGVGQVAAIYA